MAQLPQLAALAWGGLRFLLEAVYLGHGCPLLRLSGGECAHTLSSPSLCPWGSASRLMASEFAGAGAGAEMAPLLIRICLQESQGQLHVCTVLYLRVQGADGRLTTLSPSLLLSLAWNLKKRRKNVDESKAGFPSCRIPNGPH